MHLAEKGSESIPLRKNSFPQLGQLKTCRYSSEPITTHSHSTPRKGVKNAPSTSMSGSAASPRQKIRVATRSRLHASAGKDVSATRATIPPPRRSRFSSTRSHPSTGHIGWLSTSGASSTEATSAPPPGAARPSVRSVPTGSPVRGRCSTSNIRVRPVRPENRAV
jgi:hypothetical protein